MNCLVTKLVVIEIRICICTIVVIRLGWQTCLQAILGHQAIMSCKICSPWKRASLCKTGITVMVTSYWGYTGLWKAAYCFLCAVWSHISFPMMVNITFHWYSQGCAAFCPAFFSLPYISIDLLNLWCRQHWHKSNFHVLAASLFSPLLLTSSIISWFSIFIQPSNFKDDHWYCLHILGM